MFDMGFTELMIIGIVALIVIGPERLPGVARTAGKYLGKLRRFMTDVKADVESELRADELREMLSKQQDEIQSLKEVVGDVAKEVDVDVGSVEAEIGRAAEEYQKKAAKKHHACCSEQECRYPLVSGLLTKQVEQGGNGQEQCRCQQRYHDKTAAC